MIENGALGVVIENDDPEMVIENDDPEMVIGNGDPEMVIENGVPGMVTTVRMAKTLAKKETGIPTEDEEGTTELEVEKKGTGKTAEKQTPKSHAKEVTKIEIKAKDRALGTEKAGGSKERRTTPEKIVPVRSQNTRRLHRRKAWVDFWPNFLASKTFFGPQNEVIHAHSGSI